jgi:invasion protein IalB
MYRTAFVVALFALIAAPAAAADQSAQPQSGAKSARPEDKIICKFINTTGSRLSRDRECKTRAQWEHEADDTRDQIEQQEQRATGDPGNLPH